MRTGYLFAAAVAIAIPELALAQEVNWTGPYVGATAGIADNSTQNIDHWCFGACDAPLVQDVKPTVGATVGANFEIDQGLIFGVEADISSGSSKAIQTPGWSPAVPQPTYTWSTDFKWTSTMRARLGVTTSSSIIYVTGGYAMAKARLSENTLNYPPLPGHPGPFGAVWDGTLVGYVIGAGIEHSLGKSSIKAELIRSAYRTVSACYADTVGPQTGLCFLTDGGEHSNLMFAPTTTAVRVGFNYRF